MLFGYNYLMSVHGYTWSNDEKEWWSISTVDKKVMEDMVDEALNWMENHSLTEGVEKRRK